MCFLCFSAADSFASLQIVGGIDMKQIMNIMDQNVFYLYFLLLSKFTQISPVILNTNVWPNPLNPMQLHALCRVIRLMPKGINILVLYCLFLSLSLSLSLSFSLSLFLISPTQPFELA